MIAAKELRIGNLVLKYEYLTGKYQKGVVDGSYLKWVADNHAKCEPIPLTPEILEQCGFVKDGKDEENIWLRLKEGRFTFESEESCNFKVVFISVMGRRVTEADILHQLQNLYFALTGEDLQITL